VADAQLKAVITAEDKASKVIAGVSGSLDKVQSKLQSMQPAFKAMAAVGTVALGAIGAVAFKAVKDYQEVEVANKMLEHAVIDVTHATREQLKATSDLADALERKGVLDGDNIKVGLAQLSTFGLSNDAVRKLGGSLADLAVNQFGVSASGEQLADSANMIAKALNGQFGILEKSGIRFTDAQKHMIEFGTEMEKVTALNQGFQQNLKFTNDVALTTFAGRLAHAKVQLQNVSENIGKALLPALDNLLGKINPVIEKVVAWTDAHPQLVIQILAVSTALAGLVAGLGFLGLALPAIARGVFALGLATEEMAITPLGLWLTAISLVVIALGLLWTRSETFRSAVQELGDKVGGFLKPIFEDMSNWLKDAGQHWDEIIDKLKRFKDQILENQIVVGMIQLVKGAFHELWDKVLNELWPALQELWATIKEKLWPSLKELWDAIQPLMPLFEMWLKVMGILIGAGILILIQVLTTLVGWITKVLTFITQLVDFIVKVAAGAIKNITIDIEALTAAFKGLVEWISKVIEKWNAWKKSGASLNPASPSFALPFVGGRASGGLVSPNRPFMVGENGPELFTPHSYGDISNRGDAGNVTINVYGDVSGQELIDKVKRGIMQELKFNVQV